jgi:hypothetical protein
MEQRSEMDGTKGTTSQATALLFKIIIILLLM